MKTLELLYPRIQSFIILYKVVLNFKSVYETLICDHSNERYRVVLSCGTAYSVLYSKLVLTFQPVDKTLVCDHSNESY